MDNKYPKLREMGVTNPDQVDRFSLQKSGEVDVLRIVYKRAKGSLLPGTKTFKFRRMSKTILHNDGTGNPETVSEASPVLREVMEELHQLVDTKHTQSEQKAIIKDEVKRLEEEVTIRLAHLNSLIDKLAG